MDPDIQTLIEKKETIINLLEGQLQQEYKHLIAELLELERDLTLAETY